MASPPSPEPPLPAPPTEFACCVVPPASPPVPEPPVDPGNFDIGCRIAAGHAIDANRAAVFPPPETEPQSRFRVAGIAATVIGAVGRSRHNVDSDLPAVQPKVSVTAVELPTVVSERSTSLLVAVPPLTVVSTPEALPRHRWHCHPGRRCRPGRDRRCRHLPSLAIHRWFR